MVVAAFVSCKLLTSGCKQRGTQQVVATATACPTLRSTCVVVLKLVKTSALSPAQLNSWHVATLRESFRKCMSTWGVQLPLRLYTHAEAPRAAEQQRQRELPLRKRAGADKYAMLLKLLPPLLLLLLLLLLSTAEVAFASCCCCFFSTLVLPSALAGAAAAAAVAAAAGPLGISASLACLCARSPASFIRSFACSFASRLSSRRAVPINVLFFCSLLLVLNSERAAFGWQHHHLLTRIQTHTQTTRTDRRKQRHRHRHQQLTAHTQQQH